MKLVKEIPGTEMIGQVFEAGLSGGGKKYYAMAVDADCPSMEIYDTCREFPTFGAAIARAERYASGVC